MTGICKIHKMSCSQTDNVNANVDINVNINTEENIENVSNNENCVCDTNNVLNSCGNSKDGISDKETSIQNDSNSPEKSKVQISEHVTYSETSVSSSPSNSKKSKDRKSVKISEGHTNSDNDVSNLSNSSEEFKVKKSVRISDGNLKKDNRVSNLSNNSEKSKVRKSIRFSDEDTSSSKNGFVNSSEASKCSRQSKVSKNELNSFNNENSDLDILWNDFENSKEIKSLRVSEDDSVITASTSVRTDDEVFSPSGHEKPPNKIKTDHKVKFSDTRKEVISSPVTESSPETVSEVIIVSSPPLGIWPLKRSASLESRDNPFLPGGELDLETEELLKRATIIRDRFSLDERNLQNKSDNKTKMSSQSQEDGSLQMEAQTVIEESISPKSANASHTTPNNKQKQNGKLEDSKRIAGIC
ncbi:hypothetical protein KUTeg_017183 [Tegillarca granosa]|uniref:Uncharacterized protein n=1 Tax=Tegillarca granosa TaxID=220873 RepID=A0ABQ9EN17_TEGGR|nr:hypothetical protein KUTeg_017183 [Tegillarca granosa]